MDNDKLMPELLNALNGIQAELRRMNQTLAGMTGTGAPEKRPPARSGIRSSEGGYGRETTGGSDTTPSYRFGKKKGPGAGRAPAGRGGKPPAKGKKGDGYPKKPR